jgi:hypothetical protein
VLTDVSTTKREKSCGEVNDNAIAVDRYKGLLEVHPPKNLKGDASLWRAHQIRVGREGRGWLPMYQAHRQNKNLEF